MVLLSRPVKAAVGFQYGNKLFSLEKKCVNLKDKYRKEYRQNVMLPVLEEYFCWVNTLNPEKGSKLADAVTYAKNQKTALCAFVQHGDVPISNNLAENAIRPFAVGRKNWLFCDTAKGAESSAIFTLWSKLRKQTVLIPMTICSMHCLCCRTTVNLFLTKDWKP